MYTILQLACTTRKRLLFVVFAGLLSLAPAAKAQTWNWTTEDIDLEGYGTSIVADQVGNLHASYYFATGGLVKYAFRAAGSSKWYKMAIEEKLGVLDTKITLDAANNPSICYTPRIMKYASWNGRKWTKQEVDPGTGLISYICSIEVSPDGKPMMSWYLESGTYFRFAILQDGVWVARSIEGGDGLPGKWNSMALDSKGHPRLAYSHFPLGHLKYASFDGQRWTISMVDAADNRPGGSGQRGMGNSLVLDARGNPLISYYTEQSIKFAKYVNGQWKNEVVEELPPFGKWSWKNFRSSLVLDSEGNPHIGFESLRGLEHAWWDGKQWHTQMLVPCVGISFFENAMTIDKNDTLYVTYRDPADGTLKIATGRSASVAHTPDVAKGSPLN